jgi:hypothetical protein
MKIDFRVAYLVLAIAFTAASSRAGEIPIDISALMNLGWTSPFCDGNSIVNGSTFPSGSQNFGGVPFAIPAGPNNYWGGTVAGSCGSGTVSLTVPVGVSGVRSVFTLLNTYNGHAGPSAYLYITFTGSGGATATQPLVGDVNVRNYNSGGYTQTINNTSTVQVWTNGAGQRLDRQQYILPAAFASQVLTSVTITDTGSYDLSRAMLSALTVSTCGAYLAEGITISKGKIIYDPSKRIYLQDVTLTNAGTTAVDGPLFFILEDLPSGVTLVNKSAATACLSPIGSRYFGTLPEGSTLAPNTTLVVTLAFSDPSGAAISYTPLVAGSLGGTP